MQKIIRVIIVIFFLVCLLLGGGSFLIWKRLNQPLNNDPQRIVFEVKPGESFRQISKRLQSEGLIAEDIFFILWAKFTTKAQRVRVGEYELFKNNSPLETLNTITSGKSIEYALTFPEGFNRYEMADLLENQGIIRRKDFLKATTNKKLIKELLGEDLQNLEGYLFPDTYKITKWTGVDTLVRGMVQRFLENYQSLNLKGSVFSKRHDLVIMGSIIEKETGAVSERPIISSVFQNRLKIKMPLQTDPTVIYGIWIEKGSWDGKISRTDLGHQTKYNTYKVKGLPYGPIANPGLDSLRAAAFPSQSEYLYFVSKNDGTHVFTSNYKDHLKAVSSYQLDRKAREGKSWRDLPQEKKHR